MTESTENPTVHEAWLAVMEDVGAIDKGEQAGSGSFGYAFRGVDRTVNAVAPMLRRHKVTVVPIAMTAQTYEFTNSKSKREEMARVTTTWRVTGPRGDSFDMQTMGAASDGSDKAVVQASSVAWRVALLQGLTIPTGDEEPDHHHTDRSSDDEAAREGGWQSEAQRVGVWERMLAHPQAKAAETLAWGKAQGLNPATFTVAQSEEWRALMDGLAETEAKAVEEVAKAFGDEEPGHDTSSAGGAVPGDDDPSWWEGFDSRGAAQTALTQLSEALQGAPDGKAKDEVLAWVRFEGIGSAVGHLTKAQAAEWFARNSDLMGSAASAPAGRVWPSKAEANRTFDSLLERQSLLPEIFLADVIAWGKEEGLTKKGLTPEMSEEWLVQIMEAEAKAEEPF